MTADVHLLLLEFGREHEEAALQLLLPTLQRLFPESHVRTTIVDNAAAAHLEPAGAGGITRIGGDNSLREFSGWDRGRAWLKRTYAPAPAAVVVLANDTVIRKDKCERIRALPAGRVAALSTGALVGWIDEYPRPIELFGYRVRQWVDTSLVIGHHRIFDALGPLAALPDDEVFAPDWRTIFREPSPLSANYRTFLSTYFWGDRSDPEFAHRWHAHAPLSEHSFDAFKAKLQCVFCEHLMSARAQALNIPLVDIRPEPLVMDGDRLRGSSPFAAAGSRPRV